ncbi:hypothetical protein Zmor_016430 [Zophobas morio]|uniref:Uncharacterized protein n=1 Tax=Zophobas morio TaxID=2755281 RepID=A0AA38M0Y0_9CUCU|nr:hypothetical protein Zmor_016430 [Zophobas morio]
MRPFYKERQPLPLLFDKSPNYEERVYNLKSIGFIAVSVESKEKREDRNLSYKCVICGDPTSLCPALKARVKGLPALIARGSTFKS